MTNTSSEMIGDLYLELGGFLPSVEVAYVTYGKLALHPNNAVLLTHGYTTTHLFCEGGAAASESSWHDVVGPGKPIDTERYFVVSSNMLGSSYGTTAPRSIDPRTGNPYGPHFPPITLKDIVTVQRRLLERLGINRLLAVIGPSYGGMQAFSWATEFPDFMKGTVAVVTSLGPPPRPILERITSMLRADPNWNGGDYYATGGVVDTLTDLRENTLRSYGIEEDLEKAFPERALRDAKIRKMAQIWAEGFDANSLLALGGAMMRFDPRPKLASIRSKVLFVLSRTDAHFPPSIAAGVMAALEEAGVDARYFEIDSKHGHLASGLDAAKWEPILRRFLSELQTAT